MEKVTQQSIEDRINRVSYHVFVGTSHTVCCVRMLNGFTVVGESACVDPKMFDEELGRKYSYEDALMKLFELEAYRIKDRDSEQNANGQA